MYTAVLIVHSWLRWLVIISGVGATLAAFGKPAAGSSEPVDRWGLAFMMTLDVQMLLGLLLYLVLSPTTTAMFADFGAAMRDPAARFWAVEHVGTMMFSVIIVHVGRVLGRKAPTPGAKHARLLICFVIAILAILARTPWPGMVGGRPLFRL